MANRPLHPCAHPGCRTLTAERYCPAHRWQKSAAAQQRHKLYASRLWRRLRQEQLLREPWCRACAAQGRRVRATDVDHIIPHEGDRRMFADKSNLQSLCHACHSAKTRDENGKKGYGFRG